VQIDGVPGRMDQHHFALRGEESSADPGVRRECARVFQGPEDFDRLPNGFAGHQQIEIVEFTPAHVGIEPVGENGTFECDGRYASIVKRRENTQQLAGQKEIVRLDCGALVPEQFEWPFRQVRSKVAQNRGTDGVDGGEFDNPVPVQ